jgi:hypothetical protein
MDGLSPTELMQMQQVRSEHTSHNTMCMHEFTWKIRRWRLLLSNFLVFRNSMRKSSKEHVPIPCYIIIGIGKRKKNKTKSQENYHRYSFFATTSSAQ